MNNKILTVPPNLFNLLLSLISFLAVLCMFHWEVELENGLFTNGALLMIALLLIAISSLRYTIFVNRLVVCMLCIPVRQVFWKDICNAVFIPESGNSGMTHRYASIILQIGTEKTDILTPEQAIIYCSKHPYHYIRLRIPDRKEDIFIEALEKCLGFAIDRIS